MGATRRTSWMLGGTSDPASLNMLAGTRVLSSQPSQSVTIDWSNPLTRGLLGAFLPHLPVNLVDRRPMVPLQTPTRGAGAAGIELRSGALQYPAPVNSSAPEAKFDGTVGTALALCRQGTATNVGYTFGRYNGSSNPTWGVGLWGGTFNGPFAVWHSYTFIPAATFFNPVDKYRCIAVSGDGSTARVYADGRLIDQGAYTATTPQYDTANGRAVYCGPLSGTFTSTNTFNALAFYWNRALSAEELTKLAQNPWQIFVVEQPRPTLFQPVPKPSAVEPWFGKRVRTVQPQHSIRLNSSSSLTVGLKLLVNSGVSSHNLVNDYVGPTTGTLDRRANQIGRYRNFTRGGYSRETYPIFGFSGDFTLAVLGSIYAPLSANQHLVSLFAGSTKRIILGELSSNTHGGGINPTDSTGRNVTGGALTDAPMVLRLKNLNLSFWQAGRLIASTTAATASFSDINTLTIGSPLFLEDPSGRVYLTAFATRAWEDSEIVSWSANPWQLFQPINSTVWVPA